MSLESEIEYIAPILQWDVTQEFELFSLGWLYCSYLGVNATEEFELILSQINFIARVWTLKSLSEYIAPLLEWNVA